LALHGAEPTAACRRLRAEREAYGDLADALVVYLTELDETATMAAAAKRLILEHENLKHRLLISAPLTRAHLPPFRVAMRSQVLVTVASIRQNNRMQLAFFFRELFRFTRLVC
jgi:hypothetical protein